MVNPIRFGGIASGLDTESLVKQLVSAEKTRVDKFTQQKIWKQWQQTAYTHRHCTNPGKVSFHRIIIIIVEP